MRIFRLSHLRRKNLSGDDPNIGGEAKVEEDKVENKDD